MPYLKLCLTGKALAVYHSRTRGAGEETHEEFKGKVLVGLGHGMEQSNCGTQARKNWIHLHMDTLRTLRLLLLEVHLKLHGYE